MREKERHREAMAEARFSRDSSSILSFLSLAVAATIHKVGASTHARCLSAGRRAACKLRNTAAVFSQRFLLEQRLGKQPNKHPPLPYIVKKVKTC